MLSKEHLLRQKTRSLTHRAFRTGTARLGPQKPILRVGGGESLCYMERLSPLSENKDLPLGMPTSDLCLSSSTDRAGAQGGQVALFGITDIALRCSGTLKMTLSQPGQADPATILSRLISLMAADLPSLSGPGLEADWREKAGKESTFPSPR